MSAYTASQFSDEKYALAITIYGCASILKQGLWTGLIASKYLRTIDDDLLKQKSIVRQGIDNVKEKIPKINTLPEPERAYRTIDDLI